MKRPIKQTITNYFLENPTTKVRVRELERTLKLPLPSVIRYCKELKDEGLLTTITIGNVNFYTPSRNEHYITEKKLYNLRKIYESGLIKYIKDTLSNPGIMLFGSYAKGEDMEDSDIDLYIESPSKKELNIKPYEKKLEREIHLFRYKNLKEINPQLANNIISGTNLGKPLEVFT